MEEKSKRYQKAEALCTVFLMITFCVWCPIYLIVVRPIINAALEGYVTSYPAVLHLIPILAPIVLIALIMSPLLPPKQDMSVSPHSKSVRK